MPAYVIGHISVIDPTLWEQYRAAVPATLAPCGGELLFRGRLQRVLGGAHGHQLSVAIRFADLESAQRWFESAAYQALIPLRQRAAAVDLLLFEGD